MLWIFGAAAGAQPELGSLGQASIALDGPWRFHAGDDPAWAAPGFDDSAWEQIETGKDWETQGHPGLIEYGWYRRRVDFPANPPQIDLALYVPYVQDAAEIYYNGEFVGRYGKLPPKAIWYGAPNPAMGVIPLGPARSGVLAIRVWKAPYTYQSSFGEGGLRGVPRLGSLEAIKALRTDSEFAWLRAYQVQLLVSFVAGLVSLGGWIVWLRDRSNWMVFWLALYMLRPLALGLADMQFTPWRIGYGVDGVLYSTADTALWFLLLYLLNLRANPVLLRWTRILAIVTIVSQALEGSLEIFDWQASPRGFLAVDVALTLPGLLAQVWGVVLVLFAFRQRLDGPRWFLVISALLMDAVGDAGAWTGLGERWTHWTFAESLSSPLFVLFGGRVNILTLCATLLLVAVPLAAWHSASEQRRRASAFEQEYRSAQEVQQLLIPEAMPELAGFSVASAYRPAREVGGDFFQVLPLANGESLTVIGDVSGKGLGAALAVALIVGALRATVETTTGPAEILAALNRRLYGRLQRGFATCLVLRLNPGGDCVAANAGHLAPYLDGHEMELEGGLPLGLSTDVAYTESRFRLAAGARLTLMTDGVVEARSKDGQLFGFERTMAISSRGAEEIADAAQEFGQEDDITVLTLTRAA